MFQKASEEMGPNTLGGRTVAAFFAFCTIIACSSFTANLAAIKVTTKEGISISGIRDKKVIKSAVLLWHVFRFFGEKGLGQGNKMS